MRRRPRVLVVGCGLIGTSLALALTENGAAVVHLRDTRRSTLELAVSRGAGTSEPPSAVDLVVVAVPPSVVLETVVAALAEWPEAVVTDVASVKAPLRGRLAELADRSRYVGSHPMAGSERSGPMAASAQLFEGRPWAVTPTDGSTETAVRRVERLAADVGAVPLVMEAEAHDEAVALVSHVPYILAVLAAARLADAPSRYLALSGPGLRDVTRVAGSAVELWTDILSSNAEEVGAVLRRTRDDLDRVIDGLDGDADALLSVLGAGRQGRELIPGKHGEQPDELATVYVAIADEPGELSRVFGDAEQSGVNIEDIRIDHELGRPVGLVEIAVLASAADTLVTGLLERGWSAYR